MSPIYRPRRIHCTFILLSQRAGENRVDFRFDPILLTEKYTIDYHLEKFDMMC